MYDNHNSHISIEIISKARENYVTLLTLPPHCSHKMQPLDVSIYGPFKTYYNAAAESLMFRNPELTGAAILKAFTPANITSGFKCTGIFPFNENIFSESDFLCADVTDRPFANIENSEKTNETGAVEERNESINKVILPNDNSDKPHLTLDKILPFPKAAPRKKKAGGRKPGRTRILTRTPEKNIVAEAQMARKRKIEAKKHPVTKSLFSSKAKNVKNDSSSESEYCDKDLCDDSESDYDVRQEMTSDEEIEPAINLEDRVFEKESFVVVKIAFTVSNKECTVHYVTKILENTSNTTYLLKYMRRGSKIKEFYFPQIEDSAKVAEENIVAKLQKPTSHGGSSRRHCKYFYFQ